MDCMRMIGHQCRSEAEQLSRLLVRVLKSRQELRWRNHTVNAKHQARTRDRIEWPSIGLILRGYAESVERLFEPLSRASLRHEQSDLQLIVRHRNRQPVTAIRAILDPVAILSQRFSCLADRYGNRVARDDASFPGFLQEFRDTHFATHAAGEYLYDLINLRAYPDLGTVSENTSIGAVQQKRAKPELIESVGLASRLPCATHRQQILTGIFDPPVRLMAPERLGAWSSGLPESP
jgi:hypothetical protein